MHYFIKKHGTVNATATFRLNRATMDKVRDFFIKQKSPSCLVTSLLCRLETRLANGAKVRILKPETKLQTFEFQGNPLSFKNGTEIISNGRGWYTAVGNGTLINACFFALNAVLNQLQALAKPEVKGLRPYNIYLEPTVNEFNRFVYKAYTADGVPLNKKFNLPTPKTQTPRLATKTELEKLQSKYALH
jgi:hypothetical protein